MKQDSVPIVDESIIGFREIAQVAVYAPTFSYDPCFSTAMRKHVGLELAHQPTPDFRARYAA